MRKAILLVLLIVLGTMPLQTSAQGTVSVPSVDLECENAITGNDETEGPLAWINSSSNLLNDTTNCTVTNPNTYAERIQIQVSADGLATSNFSVYPVQINAYAFSPKSVSINEGDTVRWRANEYYYNNNSNTDEAHDVTANDSSWGSGGTMNLGSTYNKTFTTSGTYDYHCSVHSWMYGTVVVSTGSSRIIDLGPGEEKSFNVTIQASQNMNSGIRILNVTATVVEANGVPPVTTAESYVEGEIWIINDDYVEPEPEPCYTTYTPEMMHAANNWRFVDLETRYTTDQGELVDASIRVQLNHSAAPLHSENFALLALMGCYDNVIFHLAIEGFVIQGGDFEYNSGSGGYAAKWYGYCQGKTADDEGVNYTAETCQFKDWSLPGEHTNGLRHGVGSLAAAHASLNTDGSQFYILPSDSDPCWLDGDQEQAPNGGGCVENKNKDCSSSSCHTVFGQVIAGQNHVDAISKVNTGMGNKPSYDVTIVSASLTNGTDSDEDGLPDDVDEFPNDANETTDSDGDGVGDNSDAFPDDGNETHDDDGDGVGNNSDAFPDDPDETHDDDGDGVGNNTDEFPQDPDEQFDDDDDGVGNNEDAFPDNPYASNWATIYAAVGTLIVLLIGAGVMISRMKKQDELPTVASSIELQQLDKQIEELQQKKNEMIGQEDPTELMFEE